MGIASYTISETIGYRKIDGNEGGDVEGACSTSDGRCGGDGEYAKYYSSGGDDGGGNRQSNRQGKGILDGGCSRRVLMAVYALHRSRVHLCYICSRCPEVKERKKELGRQQHQSRT
jgi:hypothetical protein